MTIRPKDRKLAELILFISERSEGDPRFGEEKLKRILFNADFSAFPLAKLCHPRSCRRRPCRSTTKSDLDLDSLRNVMSG
jgi:hypothetical protein